LQTWQQPRDGGQSPGERGPQRHDNQPPVPRQRRRIQLGADQQHDQRVRHDAQNIRRYNQRKDSVRADAAGGAIAFERQSRHDDCHRARDGPTIRQQIRAIRRHHGGDRLRLWIAYGAHDSRADNADERADGKSSSQRDDKRDPLENGSTAVVTLAARIT
jgi:hypothetical protein